MKHTSKFPESRIQEHVPNRAHQILVHTKLFLYPHALNFLKAPRNFKKFQDVNQVNTILQVLIRFILYKNGLYSQNFHAFWCPSHAEPSLKGS